MRFESFFERLRRFASRVMKGAARRLNRAAESPVLGTPSLPDWVRQEAIALAAIEPELITADGRADHYQYYHVPSIPLPGRIYEHVLSQIPEDTYTHVMLLPWLKQGGADRGALYHLRALKESNPSARILAIATEPADSPWKDRLPQDIPYIEFGLAAKEMDFNLQVQVLTRLLVQLRPAVIHNINSRCGWEAIKCSGLALCQHSTIFASLFCDDHNAQDTPVGYARDYLRSCYRSLERVFCDNSVYPGIWSKELGVPSDLFEVLPFPYDREVVRHSRNSPTGPRRVLWAGRLDRQKRPDVLAAIAERMPELLFDVHGGAVIGAADPAVKQLAALPNVVTHGFFSRLEDVVSDDHIAYLHTTAWEGVPTILFDVAAAGVPICAPDVGGIPDFVDRRWLISDFEDIDAYVEQLSLLASSDQERDVRRSRQYDVLEGERSWEAFYQRITAMPMYLGQDAIGGS
ncbi:glycosyltransferase [Lysobacter soli]|uniref:glycosyltransferase n=1 Tax=Lysobacter soli TaxID=453783 RepID=UPI0036A055F4